LRQRAVAGRSQGSLGARAVRARRTEPMRRRRRLTLFFVGSVAAMAAGVALLGPIVHDAIIEITLPLRHEDIIRQQAREKSLDPALVAAVIYRESKFRDQTSKAGAKGLMQILPDTAKFIAKRTGGTEFELRDLGTPQINISYGCWYLRYLLDRYHGNEVAAVAAYNAGHERVEAWGGSSLEIDDIGFPETRQYTEDVFDKRGDYAKHYGDELGL
jgi:soluble lytic murein transglycosylase